MKKGLVLFVLVVVLFSFVSVSGQIVVINTNSYEPVKQDVVEKNVTRTLVFYKSRRVKDFVYDQSRYDFERDKVFDERLEEKIDNLNYKDKVAVSSEGYRIDRGEYLKYYECYDCDLDYYYKDYDYLNPCLR